MPAHLRSDGSIYTAATGGQRISATIADLEPLTTTAEVEALLAALPAGGGNVTRLVHGGVASTPRGEGAGFRDWLGWVEPAALADGDSLTAVPPPAPVLSIAAGDGLVTVSFAHVPGVASVLIYQDGAVVPTTVAYGTLTGAGATRSFNVAGPAATPIAVRVALQPAPLGGDTAELAAAYRSPQSAPVVATPTSSAPAAMIQDAGAGRADGQPVDALAIPTGQTWARNGFAASYQVGLPEDAANGVMIHNDQFNAAISLPTTGKPSSVAFDVLFGPGAQSFVAVAPFAAAANSNDGPLFGVDTNSGQILTNNGGGPSFAVPAWGVGRNRVTLTFTQDGGGNHLVAFNVARPGLATLSGAPAQFADNTLPTGAGHIGFHSSNQSGRCFFGNIVVT